MLRGAPHRGIVRLVNFRAAHQGLVCAQILRDHADDLQQAAIITAEPGRVRIRKRVEPS